MPVAGRKPKEGPKQNHMPAAHDWVEVADVPFNGKRLVTLPQKRRVEINGYMHAVAWEPLTKSWWKMVSSMPHCVLWKSSDWMFAVSTAIVADNAHRGVTAAAGELRQREKIMGTTADARRDLRIRYVARVTERKQAIVPSTVASIDERRRRSTGADSAS